MKNMIIYFAPIAGLLAIAFAFVRAGWVKKQDAGTDKMKEIAGYIQEGAMAFLASEYKYLSIFVVVRRGTARRNLLHSEQRS